MPWQAWGISDRAFVKISLVPGSVKKKCRGLGTDMAYRSNVGERGELQCIFYWRFG